ncbi:MAG: heme-binding domain-containing protein [Bacteroidetes bacterium]|nr:heme-binding domain-containing protein [Bacteroidota bacterium]
MNLRRTLRNILIAVGAVVILMQFIQPSRENPPIDPAMTLQSHHQVPAEIASLLDRACRDCHSNATVWPFYSYIAPASWLVSYDVMEGRKHLNFSEWGKYKEGKRMQKLSGIYQAVTDRTMPMPKYIPLHPEADLTDAERTALSSWAQQEAERMMGGGEETGETEE